MELEQNQQDRPASALFIGLSGPRLRILQDIKALGFEKQNEHLYQHGFTKLSQNLKYLKIHQGDLQAILAALNGKHSRMNKEGSNEDELADHKEHFSGHGRRREKSSERDRRREKRSDKSPREKHSRVTQEAYLKDYTQWPADVDRVYLDGNNMLYVEDAIRKLALRRSKKGAEKVLSALALEFSREAGIPDVVLVFDSTSQTSSQKVQLAAGKGEGSFVVVSAAPKFKIADDALVSWSEEELKNKKRCLFVTSDRGLQVRLSEQGVENIMKTKKWFGFVKGCLGEARYESILNTQTD